MSMLDHIPVSYLLLFLDSNLPNHENGTRKCTKKLDGQMLVKAWLIGHDTTNN